MISYVVEKDGQVVAYTETLKQGKYYLLNNLGDTLIQLKGPNKYEGFHQYYIIVINGKLIKQKPYIFR